MALLSRLAEKIDLRVSSGAITRRRNEKNYDEVKKRASE
jgi:hypothetical protein